jgi:hypothetical protein
MRSFRVAAGRAAAEQGHRPEAVATDKGSRLVLQSATLVGTVLAIGISQAVPIVPVQVVHR